jgi:ribosomal protein L11 methyltransferase
MCGGTRDGALWIALRLEIPAELEDELAAEIGAPSLGVEVVPCGPGRSRLCVYLPAGLDPSERLDAAEELLRGRGLDPAACLLAVEPVEDGHWVERYQASLRPLPLGERFVAVPDGRVGPEGEREPIRLVPGRAFGTGEHATTRLCAAALERFVRPGSRWLDLGTGSGILAIVAARCGAVSVDALDDDPEAVEVAREVVEANEAAGSVRVREGSADSMAGARLDGCVANIATPYFLSRASEVAAVLAPGGWLLCSGLLGDDAAEVRNSLGRAGLGVIERLDEGAWCLLVARKDPVT